MRNNFDRQLRILNSDLIAMGALCESAIASAVKALFDYDLNLVSKTIETEHEIDLKEKSIESLCLKLLLQQQPVARDLRTISSALKMITDMERIGDQASDIAEIVKIHDLSAERNNIHIHEMAQQAIKMVTQSIDAFVNNDIETAKSVIKSDDIVDDLFIKIKNDIIELISDNRSAGETAIDTLMIAKYLERIGDHATNIAEWVVFSINGIHKEN